MSVTGKATSYFPGLPEWDVPTKSQTTSDFIVSPSFSPQNYGPQPTRKPYKTNKNNVNLGDEKFEYKSSDISLSSSSSFVEAELES